MKTNFYKELQDLINRHSMENNSNTPDFILAKYIENCLRSFEQAINEREKWYGRSSEIATQLTIPDFDNTILIGRDETPVGQSNVYLGHDIGITNRSGYNGTFIGRPAGSNFSTETLTLIKRLDELGEKLLTKISEINDDSYGKC